MNFVRKLSTQLLNEKSYNIIVRENSRNNIFCLKGNYKITTNINRYQYYIKKYEILFCYLLNSLFNKLINYLEIICIIICTAIDEVYFIIFYTSNVTCFFIKF